DGGCPVVAARRMIMYRFLLFSRAILSSMTVAFLMMSLLLIPQSRLFADDGSLDPGDCTGGSLCTFQCTDTQHCGSLCADCKCFTASPSCATCKCTRGG